MQNILHNQFECFAVRVDVPIQPSGFVYCVAHSGFLLFKYNRQALLGSFQKNIAQSVKREQESTKQFSSQNSLLKTMFSHAFSVKWP